MIKVITQKICSPYYAIFYLIRQKRNQRLMMSYALKNNRKNHIYR
jgi:hypothetical protein